MIRIDDRELRRKVGKLVKVASPETMLRLVSTRQVAWIDQNFREEGAERKWKPLAPGTVRARRGSSAKILQDTGRLKQSFAQRVGPRRSVVGTNLNYAGFHHEGTSRYTIRPKTKKILTIPNPQGPVTFKGGRLSGKRGFFARSVNHPGLPARPLLPSKSFAERMAERTIEASFERAS